MAILGCMKKDLTKHLAFFLKHGILEGFQEKSETEKMRKNHGNREGRTT